jgi:ATP-dependent DNA helicase DinG
VSTRVPDSASAYLGAQGPLAARLAGFQPRHEQQLLADAVDAAIQERAVLVAEAGTGVGKTFAYLVPALMSGRKVIVSTGTKTLQDQLFEKDLPLVRDALEVPVRLALLKGRGNYLCLHRMDLSGSDGRFESREEVSRFQQIRQWAARTRTGDLTEIAGLVGDPALRARVSSTADNCLGGDCPQFADCFLMEARRRAQEADVVVVNHHLLMADWALKEGGFGEVLPSADAYILDEAHQLPEVAAQFFGLNISSRQLADLVRDTKFAYFEEAGDLQEVIDAADAVGKAAADLRLALGLGNRRAAWAEVEVEPAVDDAIVHLREALSTLTTLLEPLADRGKNIEQCGKRTAALLQTLDRLLAADEAGEAVRWFETYNQSFILRLTPLDVAKQFRGNMERHRASWVFTSATLAVGGGFGHFQRRMGLGADARTLRLDSPFDYRRNALLYLPLGLPHPASERFDEAFLRAAVRVLEASRGRAFLLFTSHRALRFAADWLASRVPFPLLVQGEASQAQLLERFRSLGNAVLLGTSSFWEGVDVRGEALSAVLIDRLPFASPGDPVMQARIDAMNRRGANSFMEHQLPLAVIALRQGVGRLIRDPADRGVLMIGDNRLLTKSYGRIFLDSLPPAPLVREPRDVEAFFEAPAAVP